MPLAIDLFCGLGGWAEGLMAEGWDVIGFDIERHVYGEHKYPAILCIQDVLTLDGAQFRNADLIVASPPCQAYSYRAMPWKRAKALPPPDNTLFEACFRIQREACAARGGHIPMVVENVRGAQPWVGRARWNFGSFYLWGDTPCLMPWVAPRSVLKQGVDHRANGATNFHGHKNSDGSWFAVANNTVSGHSNNPRDLLAREGFKSTGLNWTNRLIHGQDFTRVAGRQAEGRKQGGDWFSDPKSASSTSSSKSPARKMASAMIAKIPLTLSRHIGRCFYPAGERSAA
jgi:hypothetical protein